MSTSESKTGIQIRPFEKGDYDAVVNVRNEAMPRDHMTIHRMRDRDENHQPHLKLFRYVAEEDGEMVGVGDISQSSDMYHPRKFGISVCVRPDFQDRGIGTKLYNYVTASIAPFEPIGYQARTYQDEAKNNQFLIKRGFREDFRTWESRLDVRSFKWASWADYEKRLEEKGVQLKTLKDLTEDPDRDRRVFELDVETASDIPSAPSITSHASKLSPAEKEERFKRYVTRVYNNPDRPDEAFFVAVKGGEYIGLTYHSVDHEDDSIEIEMTGVRREYRGQGVGTALKLKAVAYAQKQKLRTMVTGNDTANQSILAINEKMGFAREPELVFYVKDLPHIPAG